MFKKRIFNVTFSSMTCFVVLGLLTVGLGSCRSQSDVVDTSSAQENAPQTETEQIEKDLVHLNLDEEGIALRGYDPVSYFTEGQPVEGQAVHSFVWNDAIWHFASAKNRDLFSNEPEKYAPANGGYCTFGIGLSKKFDGDPLVWSVVKSRLYVFLNEDVQQKFLQDSTGNLQKVATNWPVIQFQSTEEL